MRMSTRVITVVLPLALGGGCGGASSTPAAPSTPTPPAPPTPPVQTVLVNSFSLTRTSGSIRASELGWTLDVNLTQALPGLFVRVDLAFGPDQANHCYASELTHPNALNPQRNLQLRSTGFFRAQGTWPGFSCAWGSFQPTSAGVRVFGAANPYALTPVAGGSFPVSLTVTE